MHRKNKGKMLKNPKPVGKISLPASRRYIGMTSSHSNKDAKINKIRQNTETGQLNFKYKSNSVEEKVIGK